MKENIKKYNSFYNKEIAKRFVSDYKLPIPLFDNKWESFEYFIKLYEEEFQSENRWYNLCDYIYENFNGNVKDFLKDFYNRRESMVQFFLNNDAQKDFCQMDMNRFVCIDRPNVSKNNVYNGNGHGQFFISIDLRQANFQAMKYVNPALVNNAEKYEDFVSLFAPGNSYIKNSKYLRQCVFGQANPKRQIAVETYLTNKIWKLWKEWAKPDYNNIISFSNDEFVIKLQNPKDITNIPDTEYLNNFVSFTNEKLNLDIKVECFGLQQMQLCTKNPDKPPVTFFIKENIDGHKKLMCVPLNYRAIITKLLNKLPIEELDLHFPYEGYDCKFCETFYITKGD